MTNDELINAYCAANGLKRERDDGSLALLTPFLFAALAYDIFNKNLRPLPVKHEAKRIKNEWVRTNNGFFRVFWGKVSDKVRDDVIGKIDELASFCERNMLVLKVATMNCMRSLPLDQQERMGDCLLCNALAQYGYRMTEALYPERVSRILRLGYFDSIMHFSKEFSGPHKYDEVDEKEYDKFRVAGEALENRMILWIKQR